MMPAGGVVRRYWDASCFIALLNSEEGAEDCESILNEAKEAKTLIYVSPLVQTEVIRPRGSPKPIPVETRTQIQSFFENDYIKWRIIDRDIANSAQNLCWDYGLHPRDALHLAVALDLQCDLLETYDPDLLKLNGRIPNVSLGIQKPRWEGQPELFKNR